MTHQPQDPGRRPSQPESVPSPVITPRPEGARKYELWLCDACGDNCEAEPGEECEFCCEGTVQVVEVVPLSRATQAERELERLRTRFDREHDKRQRHEDMLRQAERRVEELKEALRKVQAITTYDPSIEDEPARPEALGTLACPMKLGEANGVASSALEPR